jgi:hypothetical protein
MKGLEGFIKLVDANSLGSCHRLCHPRAFTLPRLDGVILSFQRRHFENLGGSMVLG